ncbi:MAG TPA: dihydroorotate dehydrogenase-like protein, partial [Roseiflexaceae bacterium]|nr:dihydroorotate dehydrogenase-like protein [Roseiflexaceae bacterium]
MIDLHTDYLGLRLKSPLVASASPLSKSIAGVRQLAAAGAAAIVLYSLFEEQISHESRALDFFLDRGAHTHAEALTYFPELERYHVGPERYLEHLAAAKRAVDVPVIGSLNGHTTGGWVEYARLIEQAGADALELNIYALPTDPDLSAAILEESYIQLVRDVVAHVSIPVAVKLSPFFSALPNMARRLVEAGAHGLVLFNRFYQPDLDIEALEVVPNLQLSSSTELRLPLRWIAILYGHIDTSLALTSGVHTHIDALKSLMAGADVVMMASELIRNGPQRLAA